MTVTVETRWDINLTTLYRVAWQREDVRIADAALARIASSRASFLELIDKDPSVVIYGVTTAMGERASQRLAPEERDGHARLKPFAAATSFGDSLPDRTVRGIVFARLTNFLEGHAATTPRIARAVAAMLDGGSCRRCLPPAREARARSLRCIRCCAARHALRAQVEGTRLADQRLALRGGAGLETPPSPRAAACTLRSRPSHVHRSVSRTARAYDEALEASGAMRTRRRYCARCASTSASRRTAQLPGARELSHRARILGHAHRAVSAAERSARISLASISDNPVYLPPDARHPFGRCISTGGYHNAMAAPALDDLAGIWADICLLCDRHSARLLSGHVSQLPDSC